MIFFITFLRALAACIITNSHYTGIYPTDIIASGGLLGDVLFFAVSGYCLYDVKKSFFRWYGKRLYRVELPTIIITAIYVLIGAFAVNDFQEFFNCFIYPTHYHFVTSILILYIPFYFCMKIKYIQQHLAGLILIVFSVFILFYLFFYDKSYYHIDEVSEGAIRFLFGEAMLLGAWFRQNDKKCRNCFKTKNFVMLFFTAILYFASKMAFSRYSYLSSYQILNQFVLFILLYYLFAAFASIDEKLEKMPDKMKKTIQYISNITLEIYIVQGPILTVFRERLFFPLNWLLLTISIITAATLLHYSCKYIYRCIDILIAKIFQQKV